MDENLTSKTLHGLKWSYCSTIVNAVLQIGFTAIMARLLEPAAFGLIAMAGIVLRFGGYFAQMGVGQALVQKAEVTQEEIRAAFTASVLLGFIFSLFTYFAAPLGLYIFNAPEVVPVIRWMGFSFLLAGISITSTSILRRRLDFRSLAIIEIIAYVIGYGLMGVIFASSGFGVWSLVAAALSQSGLTVILSYLFARHDLALIFDWKFFKPLYSFGSRVSMIGFLEFMSSTLDTLVIGRLFGATPLGIYNRAFMLVNLPMQYATSSFSRVLLPSFSRIQKEIPRIKKAYLSSILLAASFLMPACLGIAASSQEIVLLVLGDQWVAAIPILQILALATPLNLLSHFGAITCEATAALNVKFLIQITYILLLGILFYVLGTLGIKGIAIAVLLGAVFIHMAYFLVVRRLLVIKPNEIMSAYMPCVFSGVIVGGGLFIASFVLRRVNLGSALVFTANLLLGLVLITCIFYSGPLTILRKELQQRLINSGIASRGGRKMSRLLYWLTNSDRKMKESVM